MTSSVVDQPEKSDKDERRASRFVHLDELSWEPTHIDGISMKVLTDDKTSGIFTAVFRWAPGSELPLHQHDEIEQTFVMEGSVIDDDGEHKAGSFVTRPAGHKHYARSPHGCVLLGTLTRTRPTN